MTQRKDGRWQENVFIGTVDGVPKYKTVSGKTKKEVKQKALDLKIKNKQGIDILSGDRTLFSFWADAWLNSIKKTKSADNYKMLEAKAKVFKEVFSDYKIEKIRVMDCQEALDRIAESNPRYPNRPSADKTIKEYRVTLIRIFDFCLENRIIDFNPANYTELPKGSKKAERKPLTDTEINYFVETEHPLQLCALLMLYAGLRRGEALALTWADVDLINRAITINKSANLKQGGIVKEPKTEAGFRTIPIPEKLCEKLKANKSNSLLVVSYNDKSIDHNTWKSLWNGYIRKINKKYNIELKTSAHCLRHTYCTLLYEAGVDVMTAKEYMGHSDITITMQVYTHLRDKQKKVSADKLNKYLENL